MQDATLPARWAYRLVLGRDPEDAAVSRAWAALPPARLLAAMLDTPEARNAAGGAAAHGGWAAAPPTADDRAAVAALLGEAPDAADGAALRAAAQASPAWAAACQAAWGGQAPAHPVRLAGQPFRLRGSPSDESWRALGERGGDAEAERLARLARALCPGGGNGAVALDVGANLGVTTLALAAAWPGHAALHAVEPDPEVAGFLRWNLEAAGLERARAWALALGAADGVAAFRREWPNRATSHLFPHDRPERDWKGETLRVPLRRADALLAEAGAHRLDLLKLDVEGAEEQVLAGAAGAMARFRPLVLVEFNLFTQMTLARRNPFAVLERLAALAPHLCWFRDDGVPEAVAHPDGRLAVLHAIMAGRAGVDDLILCHDLGWMERWE